MIRSRATASRTPNGADYAGRAPARSLTRPPARRPGSYQGQGANSATPEQNTSPARNAQAEPPCVITRYR